MRFGAAILVTLFASACPNEPQGESPVAQKLRTGAVPSIPPSAPPKESESPYKHPVFKFAPPAGRDDPVRNPAVAPVRISGDEPVYTEEASRARIQGIVILEIVIEADGRVSGGKVLKPLPFGLTEAAISAVRTWKYKPGKHRSRAVRTLKNETVAFKPS